MLTDISQWLSFSASSTTVAQFYNVSESDINWLSTGFLFAFVVVSPVTLHVLHHAGPKRAVVIASVLLLVGNWVRYGATKVGSNGNFAGVMVGQILTGMAQPFVLAAPTRYSDLWFTNTGRITATAVMTLANPFGGALGQLIDPFWAGSASDIPSMVLYISIIVSMLHFSVLVRYSNKVSHPLPQSRHFSSPLNRQLHVRRQRRSPNNR